MDAVPGESEHRESNILDCHAVHRSAECITRVVESIAGGDGAMVRPGDGSPNVREAAARNDRTDDV